jgi:hypothetical protein
LTGGRCILQQLIQRGTGLPPTVIRSIQNRATNPFSIVKTQEMTVANYDERDARVLNTEKLTGS